MTNRPGHEHANIEITAQSSGFLQWVCPKCTNFNSEKLNFRLPRVCCGRCRKVCLVGFSFIKDSRDIPPFNGVYCDDLTVWTTHTLDHYPPGRFNLARISSSIWWMCPCKERQCSQIDWSSGQVTCKKCESCYTVGVILYRVEGKRRIRVPLDWIMPIWEEHVRLDQKDRHH